MSSIQIFEPEETTTLVLNPRLSDDADGYNASGSTITRVLTRARWGRASLRIVTDGVGLNEGAFYRVDPATSQQPYAGSVYVRGSGTVRARLRDGTNGIEFLSDRVVLDDDHWTRLEVTGRVGGVASNDLRLYVETAGTIQGVTYYTDGWMIENSHYVTTYTDGDLEDDLPPHSGDPYFRWNGTEHDSTSTRSARYRPAGRPRGIELEDVGVYVTQASGLGMPPIRLNVMRFGTMERSEVQNFQAMARAVNMVFWARKNSVTRVCSPASLRELHLLRESIEALVKPDLSPGAQPYLLRYLDGVDSMDLMAHYESGLEFDGDLRFPYFNSFGMRMLVPDPFWAADSQDVAELQANSQIANADDIIARIDGIWQALGTGANGLVRGIGIHPNGDIYVGGDFTLMGGVADTVRVARWDGQEWHGLGAGIDDGVVFGFAFDGAGRVYIGGTFTAVDGGQSAEAIVRYDPASDSYTTLMAAQGDGFSTTTAPGGRGVQGIAITRAGMVYVCGTMIETSDTTLQVNNVARYDPGLDLAFAMGAGDGFDSTCHSVAMDLDGETPLFAGNFTANFGGPADSLKRVASYDFASDTFTQLSDGSEARTRRISFSPVGKMYVGGEFTNIGFNDVEKVAVWNRQEFYPLGLVGDGLTGGTLVRGVSVSSKGRARFGGDFTGASGLAEDLPTPMAEWNGTTFSPIDMQLPGSPTVYAIAHKGEDIYVGYDVDGIAALGPYVVTVENLGKASVGPVLEVKGPARILRLSNLTTGHVIRMDLTILDGDRLVLDLRQGRQKATSDFRGNVMDGVLPDSDVGDFQLVPGDNRIAFFALDTDGNTEIGLRWAVLNWSFDDIAWAREP